MKIENADGAVATVTGLEVGTYEFTLTVTDERKLQSSDTVTVIVREGELRMRRMVPSRMAPSERPCEDVLMTFAQSGTSLRWPASCPAQP